MRLPAAAEARAGAPDVLPAPAGRPVIDAFDMAAHAHADRPAIRYHGQAMSYRELTLLAAGVADRLGADPGAVGVAARHAPGTVAGLLGIWAAGGTYCPIDPAYPVPRREAMLAAAGCRSYLDAGKLPGCADEIEVRAVPDPDAGADPRGDVAYILFTSGSTGEPKPVMTPPGAIAATVQSLRSLFELSPADRVLQFASLNWDTCFEEILPTLSSGACLVFDDDAYSGSFPRLLRLIDREQVSVLDLPTAFWHELVHHLTEDAAELPDCVRLVVTGGEAVRPDRLADWLVLGTGARL
ncbi:MAG TPA: AMP-binding protein, partial [Micromonosporaceae bacterium]